MTLSKMYSGKTSKEYLIKYFFHSMCCKFHNLGFLHIMYHKD